RWTSLAPSMTKPATASEYMTMPVPTVVGGTPKLLTMPPIATGREATLNDMIAWPSAIAIIGTQDSRTSARGTAGAPATAVMLRSPPEPTRAADPPACSAPAAGTGFLDQADAAGRLSPDLSGLGFGQEQVQPQALGEEPGDQLALDAVAGGIERRGEGAEPALARRDGDDAAADPALARQPDVVQPVARGLVQPGGRHHRERVVADDRVDQALPGQRVDPAVGQGRAHDREIPRAHVERALPGVEVGRFGRVEVDAVVALQQACDALVAEIGRRRDRKSVV